MTQAPPNQQVLSQRNIVTNIIHLLAGSAFSQGFAALTILITARQLGPEQYGQYAATLVLASIASTFFSLGLNIWFLHEAGRKPEEIQVLFGSVFALKLFLGGIWCILMILLSLVIHSDTFPSELIQLNTIVILLDNLFATVIIPFKASLRNQVTSGLMVASDLLWFLATLILINLGFSNSASFIRARIFILTVSLIATWILIYFWYRPKINLHVIKEAIRHSPAFATSEILMVSNRQSDVLIVGLMLDRLAAGLYASAVSIVNALFMPSNAIATVMLPVLSNLFSRDRQRARSMAIRSIWVQLILGAGLSVMVGLGAGYLVSWLGPRFDGSVAVLRILSGILVIHALIFAASNILIANDQQKNRATIQTITVLLNISLNFLVVGWIGIRGVALVYLITEAATLVGYSFIIRKNVWRT